MRLQSYLFFHIADAEGFGGYIYVLLLTIVKNLLSFRSLSELLLAESSRPFLI